MNPSSDHCLALGDIHRRFQEYVVITITEGDGIQAHRPGAFHPNAGRDLEVFVRAEETLGESLVVHGSPGQRHQRLSQESVPVEAEKGA